MNLLKAPDDPAAMDSDLEETEMGEDVTEGGDAIMDGIEGFAETMDEEHDDG